jgi:hypothetical protein
MEHQPHAWALIIRIEESDYHSTAQSLDRDQVFGREFLAVFGEEMSLDVTRTSPLETAEQAVSRSPVYVIPVPCELLGTPKAFIAIGTDSPHFAVHVTTATVLPVGTLDSYTPSESGSMRTSLGHLSSDHEKPCGAHLVGRQLGLRPHWQLTRNASDSCFKGWMIPCRDTE